MAKKHSGSGTIHKGSVSAEPRPGYNTLGSHKKNPSEGYPNPFFRGEEKRFTTSETGDVDSPVNSVFGVPTLKSNCMETALAESKSPRGTTFGSQHPKKGRR